MFSAFSGRCDPEYRGFMHQVPPDLRSDKKSDLKNGKKEDEKKTDSNKRRRKRTKSEELWFDSCGARRLRG